MMIKTVLSQRNKLTTTWSTITSRPFHTLVVNYRETKAERRAKEMQHLQANKKHKFSSISHESPYRVTIGLEVHAQIATQSKLFSSSSTLFNNTQPNTHIHSIDVALPGTLPLMNEQAIVQGVKTSLALNGNVQHYSQFDRKHYFYRDMPQGYQITQQFHPLMINGRFNDIGIARLQIEQDSGKSNHIQEQQQQEQHTLVDLNRAGIGLMEIVTQPDFHSTEQVEDFLKKLQFLLRHIGTCHANMEQGNMRCDVNVSVALKDSCELGTRCEIKNLISVNYIVKAIDSEIERQIQVLSSGGTIEQETRSYDPKTNTTKLMRSKENAPDYRFLPDPDLPPLVLSNEYIEQVRGLLPELPDQIIERLVLICEGLSRSDIEMLLHHHLLDYFEEVMKFTKHAKIAFNWLTSELISKQYNNDDYGDDYGDYDKVESTSMMITAEQFGSLINCIESEYISSKTAKRVIQEMKNHPDRFAVDIIDQNKWQQLNDEQLITNLCQQVIESHSSDIIKYKNGNKRILSFLVGQVLQASNNLANPQLTTRLLTQLLSAAEE